MWIILAMGSAFFAGLTAILAKCGVKNADSNVVTALRTIVVLIFSWLMVFIVGSQGEMRSIDTKTLGFLVLSGLATGGSWLCYFKALQLGNVNKVTPIDKSSTILSMVFAFLLLGETVTLIKLMAMVLIGSGTYMMIQKQKETLEKGQNKSWLIFAWGSALFASLTSILGKIGIQNIDATLGTAIRTIVVLIMAWCVVVLTRKQSTIKTIDRRSWLFITLSGMTTGGSWLCYYQALQLGPASVVVPIDKLSILVTIGFSSIVLHEKLSRKSFWGLMLLVIGTLTLLC